MNGLLIFAVLLASGFFFGRLIERNHFRSLAKREALYAQLPVSTGKSLESDSRDVRAARLVTGSVVISVDYYKRILALIMNVIGGNVRSYEPLLERARREAVLRLLESCPRTAGIVNLRLETSTIYSGSKNQIGCVEVLAYGTALYFEAVAAPPAITSNMVD